MLLTTLLAGAIVHSVPPTKFVVTGRNKVRPGVFKNKISTHQSTGNGIRRWQQHSGGVEKWWQRGGVGRLH
jgi:hypothetical protein